MTWHDPKSRWARAMRRRQWWPALSIASGVLIVLVAAGLALRAHSRLQAGPYAIAVSLWDQRSIGATLMLVALAPIAIGAWRWRVERKIGRHVPAHDGLVCPKCRTALPNSSTEQPCPRCRKPYSTESLRTYWEQYAFAPSSLRPWGQRQLMTCPDGQPPPSERRRSVIGWIFVSIMLLIGVPAVAWQSGLSVLSCALRYAPMMLNGALVGSAFALLARYRRRVGDSRHCAACNYQQAPAAENPARCPECGADWHGPGGIVHGRREARPWMLWGGISLLLVDVLLTAQWFYGPTQGVSLKLLPTSTLINDTASSRSFTNAEWAELRNRTLSPAQEQHLAEALLDKRLRDGHFNADDDVWIVGQLRNNRLSEAARRRYYHEMFTAWIDAPQEVRENQPLALSLGSKAHTSLYNSRSGAGEGMVYFGGFFVGDDPTPHARGNVPAYASLVETAPRGISAEAAAMLSTSQRRSDHEKYVPQKQVAVPHAGPLRVRAILWLVVLPAANAQQPIQWQDNGTPVIPPTAEWSERIEVERIVQVRD